MLEKDQIIRNILLLQQNIKGYQSEFAKAAGENSLMRQEYKNLSGANFMTNPKRFDKLPEEIAVPSKGPKGMVYALREAYAQNNKTYMDKAIMQASEHKDASAFNSAIECCEKLEIK
jgi:hypothetical protein